MLVLQNSPINSKLKLILEVCCISLLKLVTHVIIGNVFMNLLVVTVRISDFQNYRLMANGHSQFGSVRNTILSDFPSDIRDNSRIIGSAFPVCTFGLPTRGDA